MKKYERFDDASLGVEPSYPSGGDFSMDMQPTYLSDVISGAPNCIENGGNQEPFSSGVENAGAGGVHYIKEPVQQVIITDFNANSSVPEGGIQ